MKQFALIFDNTQDTINFETVYNEKLIEFFIDSADQNQTNAFNDHGHIARKCNGYFNDINFAVCKTNEVLYDLYGKNFAQNQDLTDYLDQQFLNKQHEAWVISQNHEIDIDILRHSDNAGQAKLGYQLHDVYPDNIRKIKLAEAMTKLGYIYPYEEVNMTVHRLEQFFAEDIEYKSDQKWKVFDNPFFDTMETNNSIVNFSFGYTYVGRQYYNKWKFFDTELHCQDHYNYETLEWAFQINFNRPETIAYSNEFLDWCSAKNVRPITTQIPIANVVDLEKNLKFYRKMLYKNSLAGNSARLVKL